MVDTIQYGMYEMVSLLMYLLIILLFFYPTFRNIKSLITGRLSKKQSYQEGALLIIGSYLTWDYLNFIEVTFSDWREVLVNAQRHSPIAPETFLTVGVLAGLSFLGYSLITYVGLHKLSPILITFSLSGLYIGIGLSVLWIVQFMSLLEKQGGAFWFLFAILVACNYFVICLKTVLMTVRDWQEKQPPLRSYRLKWLNTLQSALLASKHLPFAAFVALVPLLGIVVVCLTLFGQEPDSMIRAWTETSDWQLSQRISPPNIVHDEHYLCTVGATGHVKLVKPLRMGMRHGHYVVVNRQLCIANAFEQILEEKIPNIHAFIRRNYDRYGYPIARHIKKTWQADLVYILMKPLEWFFLFVIYLFDTKPEDRIALQYLPDVQ